MAAPVQPDGPNCQPPTNPQDEPGFCLLSLDGGGVRGLSSLYILQNIMDQMNLKRAQEGLPRRKPCEVFDLIGGTSTGGLIAIMLGSLRMDVDECIDAYCELSKEIFGKRHRLCGFDWSFKILSRYKSSRLKDAIEKVMVERGISPSDLFHEVDPKGCKVFVCTTPKDTSRVHRLRSYRTQTTTAPIDATISQAALATSAATSFFDPVTIGEMKFVDGALGARDLKSVAKFFVSIGTGESRVDSLSYRADKLIKSLKNFATETGATAENFLQRWRHQFDQGQYFRFNVQHGLHSVSLDDHKATGKIKAVTYAYLDEQEQRAKIGKCAANLKLKNGRASETTDFEMQTPRHPQPITYHTRNPTTTMLPYMRNAIFVGRGEVLQELDAKFFGDNHHDRLALVGLGGIGKTQAAFQFADSIQQNRPEVSIFWINALSSASFDRSCEGIVDRLHTRRRNADNEAIPPRDLLKSALSSDGLGEWLLIVDNADDLDLVVQGSESIMDYLPKSRRGRILFTTRSEKVADAVARGGRIELRGLDIEAAVQFVERGLAKRVWSPVRDKSEVVALVKELECIPLAMTQALAYLNQNQESITEYLKLLQGSEANAVALMSQEFADHTRYKGLPNAIATTWIVSFETISSRNSKAAQKATDMLLFISCIEPKAIPRSMLMELGRDGEIAIAIEAIGMLKEFSFLAGQQAGNVYDMHSLVHQATRIWAQKTKMQDQCLTSATTHLLNIPSDTNWRNQLLWREFLPHALKVLRASPVTDSLQNLDLNYKVGACLLRDRRAKDAAECFQRCCGWTERQQLPITAGQRIDAVSMLASAKIDLGKAEEGVAMLQPFLADLKTAIPPDDKALLMPQQALAIGLEKVGQTREAIKLSEHAISMGTDDMSTRCNLALMYYNLKEIDKATEILLKIVNTDPQSPHEEWSILQATRQLARICKKIGPSERQRAITMMKRVVRVWETTAASDDYERRAAATTLSSLYIVERQYEDAIEILEPLVRFWKTMSPEDDAFRITAESQLGGAYSQLEQFNKAIAIWEPLVAVMRRIRPEEDEKRRTYERWLARTYCDAGLVEKAMEIVEPLAVLEQRILPEGDQHRERTTRLLKNCQILLSCRGRCACSARHQHCAPEGDGVDGGGTSL